MFVSLFGMQNSSPHSSSHVPMRAYMQVYKMWRCGHVTAETSKSPSPSAGACRIGSSALRGGEALLEGAGLTSAALHFWAAARTNSDVGVARA